jgi:hypothetical protein
MHTTIVSGQTHLAGHQEKPVLSGLEIKALGNNE